MALWMPTDPHQREELLRWAEARLPYVGGGFDRAKAQPVAVVRDGAIAAVVIYEHRRAATVEMGVVAATPRAATPRTIAALLAWPFTALGVRRITGIIAARNARSQRLAQGLGFVCDGRLPGWFPDDDALIFGLTREAFERSRWRLMIEPPAAQAA